jgi:hypothetical protein
LRLSPGAGVVGVYQRHSFADESLSIWGARVERLVGTYSEHNDRWIRNFGWKIKGLHERAVHNWFF